MRAPMSSSCTMPSACTTLPKPWRRRRMRTEETTMRFEIPKPLQAEHEELHASLVRATREPGAVGEAAREVARRLHPHFVREEQFALPPLALLAELARGGVTPG